MFQGERAESYAKKWMDDRMQELQKPIVSPEREKQRQEIVALSGQMMQDVRNAVAAVAEREKIELVWLKPAVRKSVKDITELVTQEITKAKWVEEQQREKSKTMVGSFDRNDPVDWTANWMRRWEAIYHRHRRYAESDDRKWQD